MLYAATGLPALQDSTLFRSQAYINGAWVEAASQFEVINPADGARIASVPDMDAGDASTAITAAQAAFPSWAARPGKERAVILRKWFDLIVSHADDLALLMTAIIAAVYAFGALEMHRFRQTTSALSCALSAIPDSLHSLGDWLPSVPASPRKSSTSSTSWNA